MEACAGLAGPECVDEARFRAAMGRFATGVAVVTTRVGGVAFGMTMNSVTSVSLQPPLLLVCPRRGSATGEAIKTARAFAVNVLALGQRDVARRFVGSFDGRYEGLTLSGVADGPPLLAGALAQVMCRVHAVHPGGDHDIILGEVTACAHTMGEPLLFFGGGFGGFSPSAQEGWAA